MNIKNLKETIITCFSIFVIGFLNGHTQVYMGSFVSPQTGNLIHFGLAAANGNIRGIIWSSLIFFGFIFGCLFSTFTKTVIKKERVSFLFGWSIVALPIILYVIFHENIHNYISLFILSSVSGSALCLFRKIAHIELNNIIVTGNMRLFSIAAYDFLVLKDKGKLSNFAIFGIGLFLFFLGAFFFGLANNLGNTGVLVSSVIICAIPYFFAPTS